MPRAKSDPKITVAIRLPIELYERLKRVSAYEHRSIGAQALHMIEIALSKIDRSTNTPNDIIEVVKPDTTTQ